MIEKSPKKAAELEKLKGEFPNKARDIVIETKDANAYLQDICKMSWKAHRAVLFIDPFGMQLSWNTLKPVGQEGKITSGIETRLA